MQTITTDELEREHGTAILSNLCGQHLTRNQQPVRLFDENAQKFRVLLPIRPAG